VGGPVGVELGKGELVAPGRGGWKMLGGGKPVKPGMPGNAGMFGRPGNGCGGIIGAPGGGGVQ